MESHVERQLHQEHPQSLQWVEEEECQRLRSFLMQVLRKYSSKKFIGVNGALVIHCTCTFADGDLQILQKCALGFHVFLDQNALLFKTFS